MPDKDEPLEFNIERFDERYRYPRLRGEQFHGVHAAPVDPFLYVENRDLGIARISWWNETSRRMRELEMSPARKVFLEMNPARKVFQEIADRTHAHRQDDPALD